MTFSGWRKYFTDGTVESGSDQEVAAKSASWRNGRQDNIAMVDLAYDDFGVRFISAPGEWWQSDKLFARYTGPNKTTAGEILQRRVERCINEKDIGSWLMVGDWIEVGSLEACVFVLDDPETFPHFEKRFQITEELVGKWIVITLDLQNDEISCTVEEHKR